jgi:non-ribosomal peptide synthetase component F
VTAGRNHPDLAPLIGYFVNTVALRNYPQGRKTFREFLREVRAGTLQSFEHQEYPFESLVEKVEKERVAGRNPVFDVLFEFQNQLQARLPGLEIDTYACDFAAEAKFDLVLTAVEGEDRIAFTWSYNQALFKESSLHKMSDYLARLIGQVTARPDALLLELDLLDAQTLGPLGSGDPAAREMADPIFNF